MSICLVPELFDDQTQHHYACAGSACTIVFLFSLCDIAGWESQTVKYPIY